MIASPNKQPGGATDGEARRRGATSQDPGPDSEHAHPLDPVFEQAAMLRDFAFHYVEAQKDAISSAVRRALLKAILGVLAALVGATFLITATVLFMTGLAELVSLAADGSEWVGNLAIGGGLLLVVGAAAAVYVSRTLNAARKRTIRKYELRHDAQRAKYGTDVTQKAAV